MRRPAPAARITPFHRIRVALSTGLLLALLSPLGGSGCGQSTDGDALVDGSLRGELATYISDDLEGLSELRYALRDADGHERTLLFDGGPGADLVSGTDIRVWGVATAEGFHVTRAEPASPASSAEELERVTSALQSAPAYAPRSFAFVLVDTGSGINTTADDVMGRLITAPDSIRNYYLADSYGTQDVTAQVFGPIRYTLTNGCGTTQLATDLRPMVPGTFQHYLWYFGSRQTACSWSGLASVGTPDKPSRDTWYNASTSCVVLVQEPGHNFGMQHSSSLACPNATLTDDPNVCTASEYGDLFDPMGGGCRHMNAWQKEYQGWFGGCNGVTVTSSGTFTVLPLEQRCDGAQFLKIPAPTVRMFNRPAAGGGPATVETLSHYFVELRTGQDFDGTVGNRTALAPEVLLHIGGDLRARNQRGLHTFLLDTTPATTGRSGFTDAALGVGKTFTDPAGGLSITVQAVSATQATINVVIAGGTSDAGAGGPTCLDGTPFTAPGPGQESCNGIATGAGGAPATTGAAGTGLPSTGAAGTSGRDAGTAPGAAGSTGAAGTSPISTGTAGASANGAAGAAGAAAPTTGAAGSASPTNGTAGTTPGAGSAGVSGTASREIGNGAPVVGHGCACDTAGSAPRGSAFASGFFAVGVALARRRRRRAS
jgi:Gametolysin peptidase M11